LSLASCGGTPASSEPVSSTAPVEITTKSPIPTESPSVTSTLPVSPTATDTEPTTTETILAATDTTTTSTTPTTSTSTAPPPPTEDTTDLTPFKIDGKSVIAVDTSSNDYREFKIKAGITNAGKTSAFTVTVNLYNISNKIFTWNVETVGVGENVILETTVGEILAQSTFTPGKKSFNIDISVADSSGEIWGNNKSEVEDVTIAYDPAERRASQSPVEKMIQDSIDNSTWYTSANKNDLMTIAKDVLKDARVNWSSAHIEIKSFDDFNESYSSYYSTTEQEKKEIKDWLEKNRYISISFIWGTTEGANICMREGTLIQLLPVLFSRLGTLTYSQANYSAYRRGYENGSSYLIEALLETYGFSVMRDKYGFSALSDISVTIGTIPNLSLKNDITSKRIWAVAAAAGYLKGDVPSEELLKIYSDLLIKPDAATYMEDLDEQVESLDIKEIENIIRWRMVDKAATMLPEEIVEKLNPVKSSLSRDSLISYQDFVILPW
jgi:hypothetical protein